MKLEQIISEKTKEINALNSKLKEMKQEINDYKIRLKDMEVMKVSEQSSDIAIDIGVELNEERKKNGGSGGYHHVTYPHYLSASKSKSKSNHSPKSKDRDRDRSGHGSSNQSRRSSAVSSGAVCPDPTTYLPFAHAGQSTPQMRTLHKIVWVLQHQNKSLTIDAIRSCLPGKKKAQINEIDYLLSTYESYNYTKSTMVNSRKVWTLCPSAFPTEFWNMQWQRTN
eukprot:UN12301